LVLGGSGQTKLAAGGGVGVGGVGVGGATGEALLPLPPPQAASKALERTTLAKPKHTRPTIQTSQGPTDEGLAITHPIEPIPKS
jgi:hypothetical protein